MIICERQNLNLAFVNRLQNFYPFSQFPPTVHDDFVPHLRLYLNTFSVPEPADIREISRDGVKFLEPLCGPRHPCLVDQGERNAAFAQHLNELRDKPTLVSNFD